MNRRPTAPILTALAPYGRLAALLSALSLGGCMIAKDKREIALQAATTRYQNAIRWGYYENAYELVEPAQRTGKPLPRLYEQLKLTGYDVVQPATVGADGNATQIVTIDYLFNDRQIMKSLTDRQVWRYDPSVGSWWLVSGLPAFKE